MRWVVALLALTAACGTAADTTASPTTAAAATTTILTEDVPAATEPATPATTVVATTEAAPATAATAMAEGCADVVAATAERRSDGSWTFDVTVSSTDTGWEKYADAWEVRSPTGEVLGTRELTHPHETEQPFTRSLSGVAIPEGTAEVTIAAHDSVLGFCGEVFTLALA
jgi:hypothetical protein